MCKSVRLIVTVLILIIVLGIGMPACADLTGTWNIETVDSVGFVGTATSLALDGSENPHISYHDVTNDDLKYAKWNGTGWEISIVDPTGGGGLITSIALDRSGNPHISYTTGEFVSPNMIYRLKYAKWTGTAWQIRTVASAIEWGYTGISFALDGAGNPHISYIDADATNSDLKYAKWTGSGWEISTVDPNGRGLSSLALDGSGNPHISYNDDFYGYLKYAKWTGSGWEISTVYPIGGYYSSLKLDGSDNPHISFYNKTGMGKNDLKYAKWTGSGWEISTVDTITEVDLPGNSLALDGSGNPHISYSNLTEGILKYAKWTGSGWEINTVDSGGRYNSLALDGAGNPHISYFDYPNRDLKYAKIPRVAPTVLSISPDHAVSFSKVHITNLEGTGFYGNMPPPVVKLTTYCAWYPCVIQTPILATEVSVISPTRITGDFTIPFSSDWVGPYNVVVINPDGQQGKLVNGFTINPRLPLSPLPGIVNLPNDPDSDGLYEDLNANNRKDFSDVVLMFNQMQWIAANEPVSAFDFNGNGRIDFNDIVKLFGEI